MIRIAITSAAFEAIKATLPVGSAAYEPQRTAEGGYFIWVERSWLNKLEALRQPGEGLSETIIRLVAMEAGGGHATGAPVEQVPTHHSRRIFWTAEGGVDEIAAEATKPRERSLLVRAGESGVADDIGDQDCRKFASHSSRPSFCGHISPARI